jgi:uncharacterized protein (TIGR03083 family)
MSDPAELREFDPYVLLHDERARLDRFFSSRDGADWTQPTRCDGWSVRDLLSHLAGSEEYNHACLDDKVGELFERYGARGATDVNSFNAAGVADRAGLPAAEVLEEWRDATTRTHRELRQRDGQNMTTAAGPYPVRLQAFHLVAELATHADDMAVPVAEEEAAGRLEWRAQFSRFVLREEKEGLAVTDDDGRTRVQADELDVSLSNEDLVEVVAARRPVEADLTDQQRRALSM